MRQPHLLRIAMSCSDLVCVTRFTTRMLWMPRAYLPTEFAMRGLKAVRQGEVVKWGSMCLELWESTWVAKVTLLSNKQTPIVQPTKLIAGFPHKNSLT